MQEDKPIRDLTVESLVVGCFYKNPDLFNEYEDLIYSEWDFDSDERRWLYNLAREIWNDGNSKLDETTINIAVNKDPERLERYKKINGYRTIERLMSKVNLDDFPKYYENLKKYNVLRALDRQGFPIRAKWDKIVDMNPEAIYNYFDHNLSKTFSYYEGISGSVLLGRDMLARFEEWQREPDIGIEIPYYIINLLLRGWRIGKLNSIGMHSGFGKSRFVSNIAMYIGIILQIPILIIVNEQDEAEWSSMLLASVINNYIGPKTGIYIDEDKILTGTCNDEEKEICRKAAKWIEKRTKIHFQEAVIYDYNALKRVLKTHKRRGVNYFIYDTFKPFRGEHGASWEAFVKTSEELKKICGTKKKGGLDMGGWITFQLTDDSLFDKILTSAAVASGKQIKHNLDFMGMARPLSYSEKNKIQVRLMQKDNKFNDSIMDLDLHKDYYIMFCDKNRGGKDKQKIIYEVDKGKLIFKELGFAVFKRPEDEEAVENRSGRHAA